MVFIKRVLKLGLTHFVTIKNLKPGMVYFYKVLNNSTPYPDNPQEFKTANLENIDELNFSFIKPLKGTILNSSLNPIDESLIFLEIPGGQRLATFSSTAGNFILPLKEVFTEDLSAILNISPDTPATVTVKKGNLASNVKIVISSSSVNLPPVTMGSNLDLTNFTPSPLTPIIISEANKPNFDFNNDGKLNSLDLAILRGKAGSRTLLKEDEINKFDINSDNLVNQQDVNIFSRSLTSN